ncbi:DNA-binding protein [Actinoplanes sp. NPDC051343]|uniref:DNA-binding protein n=1 Tax=Actinoplanes sp. NPDC051343 TaxID=3363906 RepID=UPI00379A7127
MSRLLMGTAEMRLRLGDISRQRVYQLTQRKDWPAPYDDLIQGRVWKRQDIEAWVRRHRPDLADPGNTSTEE